MRNCTQSQSPFVILTVVIFFLSGCATASYRANARLPQYFEKPVKIVVMPMDVKVFELTAGGVDLYKEDWSADAKSNLITALKEADPKIDQLEFSIFDPSSLSEENQFFIKSQNGLFNLAAESIVQHTYVPDTRFSDKMKNFDYTLGPEFEKVKQFVDSQAVLYCSGRNYIWTAGRAMMFIFAAAVFGDSAASVVPVGNEYFLMSIVDTTTGDVMWFDFASMPGNLRNADVDRQLVKQMLQKIPRELAAAKKRSHP